MDYEAAAHDAYETDSFCVADDESLAVDHDASEVDALDRFEETEDTLRLDPMLDPDKRTRLKRARLTLLLITITY